MGKNKPGLIALLSISLNESVRDQFTNVAAALAYCQFLAIAPLVGFTLFFSGKICGIEKTNSVVKPFLENYFTPQFIKVIIFFLKRDKNLESGNLFTLSIIAGLVLAYSTKGYFAMVRDAIEMTWNERRDKSGFVEFLKRMKEDSVVAIGALFIILILVMLGSEFAYRSPSGIESLNLKTKIFIYVYEIIFEFTLFFSLLYFYFVLIPPVKVRWSNAIVPAAVGSLLQVAGRAIMKVYMSNYPEADVAESFLVILIWFYYSNMVFVYSAEFARVFIVKKQNIEFENIK